MRPRVVGCIYVSNTDLFQSLCNIGREHPALTKGSASISKLERGCSWPIAACYEVKTHVMPPDFGARPRLQSVVRAAYIVCGDESTTRIW